MLRQTPNISNSITGYRWMRWTVLTLGIVLPTCQSLSQEPPPTPLSGTPAIGPPVLGPMLVAPPLQPSKDEIDPGEVLPEPASEAMIRFLAEIIRDNIPDKYQEDKDWNQTKQVYAGFKFRREGSRLETERRWKTVNHGLWRKYELRLVDPQRTLVVRLSDVHWLPDGRLHAHLRVVCELDASAWQTRYNLDLRLYSLKVDASVRMVLDLDATIGFELDRNPIPPALVIDPRVEHASLTMASFEVDRIGKLGGDLSEELGDASETFVRKYLLKPQSEKLAGKLNRQIDKKRDRLRIDAGQWLGKWFAGF